MSKRGKNFNADQVDQMVELYIVQFQSLTEIGKKFSCSGPTVKKVLVDSGVTIRPKGRRPSVRAPKATPENTDPQPFQYEVFQG